MHCFYLGPSCVSIYFIFWLKHSVVFVLFGRETGARQRCFIIIQLRVKKNEHIEGTDQQLEV